MKVLDAYIDLDEYTHALVIKYPDEGGDGYYELHLLFIALALNHHRLIRQVSRDDKCFGFQLRLQDKRLEGFRVSRPTDWNQTHTAILLEQYEVSNKSDLLALFPDFSWDTIRYHARQHGLSRAHIKAHDFDDPIQRFNSYVMPSDDDCLVWTGSKDGKGYGRFHIGGKQHPAHRWIYEFYNGTLPETLVCHHKCYNRACVNLEHLMPLTQTANKLDGFSPAAYNSRKENCLNGHVFDESNTYVTTSGYRDCRSCHKNRESQIRRLGFKPKISYLVSTYDSGSYLDRHIADLVDNQTDQQFEIIVVNPNSPGTDHMIVTKWSDIDPRVTYIWHNERESYGNSWLRAWKHATAPIVVNSNTDDFHHPEFTSKFHKYTQLCTDKKTAFFYAGITVIDEKGGILGRGIKPRFDFEEYSHTCYGGPQLCWTNHSRLKSLLDWDLMHQRATEYTSAFDYWLMLYFMSLGFNGLSIPELLTIYTQRPGSIENSNKSANNYETYSAISEFFGHNFDGHLKHAKEFRDFTRRPPREEWITTMQAGKRWKS